MALGDRSIQCRLVTGWWDGLSEAQTSTSRPQRARSASSKGRGRLPPQRVYARLAVVAYRQSHVIVQKPRDPGKAGERLSCFLRRHLSRQGGRAAIQCTLIHRPTPSLRPFTQENHRLGDTIHFFHRMPLPARYPHGRKEMQVVHRFLRFDRDALDRTPRNAPSGGWFHAEHRILKNLAVGLMSDVGYIVGK